ncbi:MAG: PAS domain S-box protein [Phycisphaerales bacterium]
MSFLNRLRRGTAYFNILIVVVLAVSCLWLAQLITRHQERQLSDALTSLRNTTYLGVQQWMTDCEADAELWAKRPRVIDLVKQLLAAPRTPQALINHPAQAELRDLFAPVIQASDFDGFFVIAPDLTSLASTRDANTGTENLLVSQPDVLARVWAGETTVSIPQVSDVPLHIGGGKLAENVQTMFAMAPVRNEEGAVIAILDFRLSISRKLEPVLVSGQFASSGKTYIFDNNGRLFCRSPHDVFPDIPETLLDQLCIGDRIMLRDPGDNLMEGAQPALSRQEQPLTRMAQSALMGRTGVDVKGYRDCRGVPVLGAWTWEPHLGYGLAVEVPRDEAFAGLYLMRRALFALACVAVFLGLVWTFVTSLLQRRIQQSEIRHRTLIANIPAVTCHIDPSAEGGFLFVSDQVRALSGYPASEFMGEKARSYTDLIHPHDRDKVLKARQVAVDSDQPYSREYRLRQSDGGYRWVNEQGRAVRDVLKEVATVDAVVSDISAVKETQSLLYEYQYALDSAAIVAVTDRAGTITHVNDRFCEISKYSREELVGQNHRILNSGHHPKAFFVDMYKTLASEDIWRDEVCNRAKDGTIYWVDTTIIVFRDDDGKIDRYLAIRADITARKLAEADLRQSNVELEARTKEMEQFTYTVSHDLKSPLVSCVGLLNCIEADAKTGKYDQIDEMTHRIRNNIAKMGDCIGDLLELSRIGAVRHEPKMLDLVDLANRVAEDLKVQADKAGAKIEIDQSLPIVYADPVRVGEVLENLISNALKYGCDGPVKQVAVGWAETNGQPHYFVRDQGAGIPEQYQSKIFGLFQRLDKSKGGTGVGLTIVKRILEIHGGKVWLESEVGRGTTFWFQFPAAPEQTEASVDELINSH